MYRQDPGKKFRSGNQVRARVYRSGAGELTEAEFLGRVSGAEQRKMG